MIEFGLMCPSRGRPSGAKDLVESWMISTTGRSQFLWYLDEDDLTRVEYPLHGKRFIGPRIGLGASLNRLVKEFPDYPYYMMCPDDFRFRTQGWEDRVLQVFESNAGIAIVYCNDLFQKKNLATEVFVPKKVIDALGYFVPPTIEHMYLDNFFMQLGLGLGRLFYLDDVIIEHMHPAAGKNVWDLGYSRVNAPEQYKKDEQRYREWLVTKDKVVGDLKVALGLS